MRMRMNAGNMNRRDAIKMFLASGCVAASGQIAAREAPRRDGALVRFAVFNDIHERPELVERIAEHINERLDFTALNGDMVEDVRDRESIVRCIVEPMQRLAKRFGAPCHFVRGNHEWRGEEKDRLGEFMEFRKMVFYRAFTLNGVRFALLDTFEEAKGKYEPFVERQTAENEWLKAEVSSSAWRNAVHRIVIMHISPPYEPYPGKPTLWNCTAPGLRDMDDILNRSRVSLACGAHLHIRRIMDSREYRPYPIAVGGGPEWKSDVATCVSVYRDGIGIRQIDKKGEVVDSAFFGGRSWGEVG